MKHRIPFFLIIFLFLNFNIMAKQSSIVFAPIWMEVGVYAEYEFKSADITFVNNTWMIGDTSATYRWQCVDLNETFAKLNVSIELIGEKQYIHLSTELYVNMVNRDIILPNGTVVGKTRLWAPPNPEKSDTIILWDSPPDKVIGTVTDVGSGWAATPQAAQKIFTVDGTGTIEGGSFLSIGLYDLDTGVMIQGDLEYEATLLALGIKDPGLAGSLQFSTTNIDLGPRELWPEILNLLIISAPVAVFLTTFVLVYRRRRRKRKL